MKRLPVALVLFIIAASIGSCNLGQQAGPTPTPEAVSTEPPTSTPQVLEMEPVSPVTGIPEGTDGYPWWNDTVFYEIYVRSFYDSDGDGIGDLRGVIEKLDYLNDGDPTTTADLGVTGIWLMPIFPSPSAHGYNVTDFYAIKAEYGTLDDLKDLLSAAHERGMRVILDLVLNHTSILHPWFEEGRDPSSPYHDWYIWSNYDPGYLGAWGQQVWYPLDGRYYYSLGWSSMADLDYTNPEVTAEMQNVARFWLEDVGVDGFRLDAAKHLVEEGTIQVNTDSTHEWWEDFRLFYKSVSPESMIVGEIWDDTPVMAEYLQGDEFDLSFEFYLAAYFIQSVNDENSTIATDRIELATELIPPLQYATFLTNHDQVRVMTQFFDNTDKARVAASMMLTAPGVPFLYYGEEVGAQGEVDNDWNRRPMQWSDAPFGGFSSSSPWQNHGPGWMDFNVEEETGDPASLLSHYRDLIRARNEHTALRTGDLRVVNAYNDALYSILRVSAEEAALVIVNLGGEAVTDYTLSVEESSLAEGTYTPLVILGEGEFRPLNVTAGGHFTFYIPAEEIPPYATILLQLRLNTP